MGNSQSNQNDGSTLLKLEKKKYLVFRIKYVIRQLQKNMKKRSDSKKKINFYNGILDKIEKSTGDVEYKIFTEEEVFYITILLKIRGVYSKLKELSERQFNVEDKLQKELQLLLKRILVLDPTLYEYFLKIDNDYSTSIYPISKSVELQLKTEFKLNQFNHYDKIIEIWISNIFVAFELLDDYPRWRQIEEYVFKDEKLGPPCCTGQGRCYCYADEVEKLIYRNINENIFFNSQYFPPPPMKFFGFY